MIKPFCIIFIVTFQSFLLGAQNLVDSLHHFSIQMPSPDFQKRQDTVQTAVGELIFTNYFYAAEKYEKDQPDNYFYSVGTCYYPAQAIHSDSTDLLNPFFEAALKDLEFNMNGETDYFEEQTIRNFPGRIFRIRYNQGQAILKGYLYLVENQFFIIQVATTHHYSFNRKMTAFLDSFRLVLKNRN